MYSPVLSYWLALNHGPAVLLLGFIEELGQDAAPPVPPAEGPFHHADDDPFDHLGQVVDHLHTWHQDFILSRCLVLLRLSCLVCLAEVLVLWEALLQGQWVLGQDSGWSGR